jgi:hypothetical protein
MTPDRLDVLVREMPPADLARILTGVAPEHQRQLIRSLPVEPLRLVLPHLSATELADVLGVVDTDTAWHILRQVPPRYAAELQAEVNEPARTALRETVPADAPVEFWAAEYEHRVAESLVRTAQRVSRLGQQTGDFVAEAFGKKVQVAVRYRPRYAALTGADVQLLGRLARWDLVVGLIVLSNMAFADDARRAAADVFPGHRVELLHWIDGRDDGTLKRLLVQIAG